MTTHDVDTDVLLDRIQRGDQRARQQLLAQHRHRLVTMVTVRLDRRLAARIDPSDIVQEALTDAVRNLDAYLRDRPLPFYPWLRRLAWERLVQAHRRHVRAQRRSVAREVAMDLRLPDESAQGLVDHLTEVGSSPSRRLLRKEMREQLLAALDELEDRDREVLVMRYLEQLSTTEIAAALGLSVAAVKMRHLRALQKFRSGFTDHGGDSL